MWWEPSEATLLTLSSCDIFVIFLYSGCAPKTLFDYKAKEKLSDIFLSVMDR